MVNQQVNGVVSRPWAGVSIPQVAFLARLGDATVRHRNIGDQMGQVFVIGFGELQFVPNPGLRAFLAVTRFETMGRNSGYLALMAGIAGGAEMVLIPEVETTLEEVAQGLLDAYVRGKAHCIIVAADGYKPGTQAVAAYL